MARPVVGNPFENQIATVSPTANPVDIYTRPVVEKSPFEALATTLSNLERKAVPALQAEEKRRAEREFAEGQMLYQENRIALGQAVKDGLIEEGASPYLKKGYRISQMNTLGMRYTAELESALERQKLYTTDDPARIEKFIAKFQEDFMNKNGMADFAAHEVAQYFGTTAAKGNEVFRTAWREKHVSWQREQNYLAFQKEVAETTIGLFKPDMSIEERKTAMDSFAKWLEGRAQTASIDGMKNAQVLDTILTGVGIAVEQSGETDVLDVFKQTKFGTAAAASSLKVQAKILDIEASAIRLEEARARREDKELNDAFEAARATTRSISESYYAEPTEQNRLALEDAISTLMATPDDANTSLGIALRKELDAYDKAFVSGGNNKTPQTELRIDESLQKAITFEVAAAIIQEASTSGVLTPADVTAKLSLWRTNFDPALDEAFSLNFNTPSTEEGRMLTELQNVIRGNDYDFSSARGRRASEEGFKFRQQVRAGIQLFIDTNGREPRAFERDEIAFNISKQIFDRLQTQGVLDEVQE